MSYKLEMFIVVFPYLKSSKKFMYKDIEFRNINDISGFSKRISNHLSIIKNLFYLRDNFLLDQITYSVLQIPIKDIKTKNKLFLQLREFKTLLAYLYSSPHPIFGNTFLSNEHASVFIIESERIPLDLVNNEISVKRVGNNCYPKPDKRGDINGYRIYLDFKYIFWVTKGSRIYPPIVSMWTNQLQDLYSDLQRFKSSPNTSNILEFFESTDINSSMRSRIYISLIWYNRSIVEDVDEDVALINLAIAFESLLNLNKDDKVSSRFKESIKLLLGEIPRLDSWIDQFYEARCNLVHEGITANFSYLATSVIKNKNNDEEPSKYRSLVSIGRIIFHICLNSLLNSAFMANNKKLPALFFTNQDRLLKICEIMTGKANTPSEKLKNIENITIDIRQFIFLEEENLKLATIIGTIKLVVGIYIETKPKISKNTIGYLKKIEKINKDITIQEFKVLIDEFYNNIRKEEMELIPNVIKTLFDCIKILIPNFL